jgi:hypothetical protein
MTPKNVLKKYKEHIECGYIKWFSIHVFDIKSYSI